MSNQPDRGSHELEARLAGESALCAQHLLTLGATGRRDHAVAGLAQSPTFYPFGNQQFGAENVISIILFVFFWFVLLIIWFTEVIIIKDSISGIYYNNLLPFCPIFLRLQ